MPIRWGILVESERAGLDRWTHVVERGTRLVVPIGTEAYAITKPHGSVVVERIDGGEILAEMALLETSEMTTTDVSARFDTPSCFAPQHYAFFLPVVRFAYELPSHLGFAPGAMVDSLSVVQDLRKHYPIDIQLRAAARVAKYYDLGIALRY